MQIDISPDELLYWPTWLEDQFNAAPDWPLSLSFRNFSQSLRVALIPVDQGHQVTIFYRNLYATGPQFQSLQPVKEIPIQPGEFPFTVFWSLVLQVIRDPGSFVPDTEWG